MNQEKVQVELHSLTVFLLLAHRPPLWCGRLRVVMVTSTMWTRWTTALQSNRFGLSRSKDAKKAAANAADAEPATPDFSAKLLHLAWHPEAPLIAAAGDRACPRCLCLASIVLHSVKSCYYA